MSLANLDRIAPLFLMALGLFTAISTASLGI